MKVATYARVSTDDKGQDPLNQLLELFASSPLGRAGPSYRIYARSNGEERRQNRLQANVGRHGKAPIRSAALLVARPAHPRGHVQDAHISAPPNGCGRQIQEPHRAIYRLAGCLRGCDHRLLAAVAAQERIRISERTKAGLARVRAQGTRLGRPAKIVNLHKARKLRAAGMSLREIARRLRVSPALVCQRLKSNVAL